MAAPNETFSFDGKVNEVRGAAANALPFSASKSDHNFRLFPPHHTVMAAPPRPAAPLTPRAAPRRFSPPTRCLTW